MPPAKAILVPAGISTSVSARRRAARKSRQSITADVIAWWLTFEPVRGRQCRSGLRLEQVGRLVAHDLEGVAALDQRDALGREPLQLDGLHLGAVLLAAGWSAAPPRCDRGRV